MTEPERWWRRWWRRRREVSAQRRDEVVYEPFDTDESIVVPAAGGVFDVQLLVHLRWKSEQMSRGRLESIAGQLRDAARGTVRQRAWSIARGYRPDDLAGVESSVNRAVLGGWCYQSEHGELFCCPSVRAMLDPRLREQLLPFEESYLSGALRAARVEALAEQWLGVVRRLEGWSELGKLERQFLLPFVAGLVEPGFAEATHRLDSSRQRRTADLAQVLRQAGRDHESVGLFEFASAYDAALQAYRRQMGLSPFSLQLSGDFGEPAASRSGE